MNADNRKLKTSENLPGIQSALNYGLSELASVLEKHKIEYWLDFGTLLGANRNGLFIPWDDDIDISIDLDSLDRFIEIVEKELSHLFDIRVQNREIPLLIKAKLILKGTSCSDSSLEKLGIKADNYFGFSIDVFTLQSSRDIPDYAIFFLNFIVRSWQMKYVSIFREGKEASSKNFKNLIWKFISVVPYNLVVTLLKICEYLIYSSSGSRYRYSLTSGFWKQSFLKTDIYPLETINFEGRQFSAPRELRSVLTIHYGSNYLIPPELHERETHSKDFQVASSSFFAKYFIHTY